jgi:hypothetical protein
MINPRDPINTGAPVNSDTGQALTQHQVAHLQALREAAELLYNAMHMAEGTTPPGRYEDHHWGSKRMQIASVHLETCVMFARKAALE